MSLVSVVIPCFNSASYIGQTLESVLSQTYRPLEIIVVDDGSQDDTASVIKRFAPFLKYYRQSNHGVSAARNSGIRMSRGEYIAFIDSDDLWQKTKIEEEVSLLNARPEIVLIYCKCGNFTDSYSEALFQDYVLPSGWVFEKLVMDNFIPCSTVVVRRSCLAKVGEFDETLRTCEDWDMWLRLSRIGQFHGISRALAYHRCRKDSLSYDLGMLRKDGIFVLRKYFSSSDSELILKKSALQSNEIKIAMAFVERRQVLKGLAGIIRGFYMKPDGFSAWVPILKSLRKILSSN